MPKTKPLRIPNNKVLVNLAKQLFGKLQRKYYILKYWPNLARCTGSYCRAWLDLRKQIWKQCQPSEAWSAETLVPRPHDTGTQHPHSTKTGYIRIIKKNLQIILRGSHADWCVTSSSRKGRQMWSGVPAAAGGRINIGCFCCGAESLRPADI